MRGWVQLPVRLKGRLLGLTFIHIGTGNMKKPLSLPRAWLSLADVSLGGKVLSGLLGIKIKGKASYAI